MADPAESAHVLTPSGRFAMVPLWLITDPYLPPLALRLYALLAAKYADRDHVAYPSRGRLADDLGCSRDTIDRALAALIEREALEAIARFDPAGQQTSNLYVLRQQHPEFARRKSAAIRATSRTDAAGELDDDAYPPASAPARRRTAAKGGRRGAAGEGRRDAAQTRSSTEPDLRTEDPPCPPPAESGRSTRSAVAARDRADGFEDFWRDYPRKVGKGAARKEWLRLKPDATLRAQMHVTLAWQRRSDQWLREGGQFVPHASTWLHQERWTDEPPTIPFVNEATIETVRTGETFLASVRARAAERAARDKQLQIDAGFDPPQPGDRRYLPDQHDQKENPTR